MKALRIKRGQQFNYWTVIREVERRKHHRQMFCKCQCGNRRTLYLQSLSGGITKSCGCFRVTTNKKHGMWKTREHSIWTQIRYRCSEKKRPQRGWRNYGGRGIRVCKDWDSFEAFYAYVGKAPSPKHTLDRIDNNGNYEPGNVRWATAKQQRANTRKTLWERIAMLLIEQAGFTRSYVTQLIADGMRDEDVARHIGRAWWPQPGLPERPEGPWTGNGKP